MNLLEADSPLEALTFSYLTFGFVTVINNLWPCLALLTAALSFWKIRASASPQSLLPPPPDPLPQVSDLVAADPAPCAPAPRPRVVDVDGVTKGKFALYYYGDDDVESESEEEWGRMISDGCDDSEWWGSWERLLRLRRGEYEKGWYTCQDLTALNGNVVRFWDGDSISRDASTCVNNVW